MRRVAALAVLAIALLAPNAHAAGLDQTCELTATRFDADTVNVLFPDSSAQYWTGSYRAIPGTHIRIDGIYPYARYTSWNVYDPILRPFTHMYDAQIAPDPGSANPFLPGAKRNTPVSQRHYTLYITFDEDFKPGPNTIYVDPQSNPVGFFTLLVYVPDKGLDVTGGVGIPQVTWQPNDQGAPAFASPCTSTQKPTVSAITPVYADQNGPDNGAQAPGRNPPVWHKFKNLCWAGQDLFFDNPYGDNSPGEESPCDNAGNGGFLSNMDNAYIYTGISRGYGKAVVLRGKAPTFADTYLGASTMPSGKQLRYWSFCQNDPYNQRYIACLRDDQVKVDKQGFYTIVISTPANKPSCVKNNWIPWGPQPWGTLILRHMLPDPSFSGSIQNASTELGRTVAPPGSMGDYYPSARYLTDPSSFCAKTKKK
jgi:hypothetical protein